MMHHQDRTSGGVYKSDNQKNRRKRKAEATKAEGNRETHRALRPVAHCWPAFPAGLNGEPRNGGTEQQVRRPAGEEC
jgi:hypothetical protein